jgi:hypothetical protein
MIVSGFDTSEGTKSTHDHGDERLTTAFALPAVNLMAA